MVQSVRALDALQDTERVTEIDTELPSGQNAKARATVGERVRHHELLAVIVIAGATVTASVAAVARQSSAH
ncbi:hypothetical protein STEG23_000164, partial [Scotinomys teguina]